MSRRARIAAVVTVVTALLGAPAALAATPAVTASAVQHTVPQDTWNGPVNTTWT